MAKKKVSDAGAQEKEEALKTISLRVPIVLLKGVKDMLYWAPGDGRMTTLINGLLREHLTKMESKHNKGKPFSPRPDRK